MGWYCSIDFNTEVLPPLIMSGSDPEMFVTDSKGIMIPAWKFLPSKSARLNTTQPYWDGFQAEFCVYANRCNEYHTDSVAAGLRGVYEAAIRADDDGITSDAHEIRVKVIVLDEDIILDFRGSARQARGPINCPFGVTLAACANATFRCCEASNVNEP